MHACATTLAAGDDVNYSLVFIIYHCNGSNLLDLCLYDASLRVETATGVLFSLNVPEASIPLCKSLNVNFKKPAQGNATVVVYIS